MDVRCLRGISSLELPDRGFYPRIIRGRNDDTSTVFQTGFCNGEADPADAADDKDAGGGEFGGVYLGFGDGGKGSERVVCSS